MKSLICVLGLCVVMGGYSVKAQQNLPTEVIAYADTVLYNGKVLTVDKGFTTAEAVAIRDGKFLAVGTTGRIVPMAGPKTRKIDLKGKTVIPGLIDLHLHPFTEGVLSYWAEKWFPNEPGWSTVDQALDGIKRAVARAKPGEPIIVPRIYIGPQEGEDGGRNYTGMANCDFMTVTQKYTAPYPCAVRYTGNLCRVLPRARLDAVSPNNPVVFVTIVNLNPYALNTAAAEAIKPYLKIPVEEVFLDPENSCFRTPPGTTTRANPNKPGSLEDVFDPMRLAQDFLIFWTEPLEAFLTAFRDATKGVSAGGITLTDEHTALPLYTGIRELWKRGELTVRMRLPYPLAPLLGPYIEGVAPEQAELLFRRLGNLSGIGDDMLQLQGLHPSGIGGIFTLGNTWTLEKRKEGQQFRSSEGRLAQPYGGGGPGEGMFGPLKPGEELFRGREAMVQGVRFGWSLTMSHVVGDRSTEEAANAVEEGLKTQVAKTTGQFLRTNHTPMANIDQIRRMAKLGIRSSIGPWHLFLPEMIEAGVTQFGAEQFAKMTLPVKDFLTDGLPPALEGDASGPVFWRMAKVITRKDDIYKRTWNYSQAISREDALRMSTVNGAQILGEDAKLGSIEVGKLADLVVIDKDYMTVPEDQIQGIHPIMTILGGKVVFEKAGAMQ